MSRGVEGRKHSERWLFNVGFRTEGGLNRQLEPRCINVLSSPYWFLLRPLQSFAHRFSPQGLFLGVLIVSVGVYQEADINAGLDAQEVYFGGSWADRENLQTEMQLTPLEGKMVG